MAKQAASQVKYVAYRHGHQIYRHTTTNPGHTWHKIREEHCRMSIKALREQGWAVRRITVHEVSRRPTERGLGFYWQIMIVTFILGLILLALLHQIRVWE